MDYQQQTKKMIKIIKEKKSLNVMKHFFAQLSGVEELDVFPIVNAISDKSIDYNTVLNNSFMKEAWFNNISLIDLRNVVVFLLWRENKIMVDQKEPYKLDCNNEKYNDIKEKETSNTQTDNLVHLLKNCFYIQQINYIKCKKDIDDSWDSFHPFFKKYYIQYGLAKLIFFCFHLIEPLI